MSTIYGVVKGNMVVLSDNAELPDGAVVELQLALPKNVHIDNIEAETRFKQKLVEMGLLTRVRTPVPISPDVDRTSVEVGGKPLSEMIIEERR